MSEKLCIFCKHFDWEGIYAASGCPTCGPTTEGGATCKARHFTECRPYDNAELRQLFLTAETCKDYERPA